MDRWLDSLMDAILITSESPPHIQREAPIRTDRASLQERTDLDLSFSPAVNLILG